MRSLLACYQVPSCHFLLLFLPTATPGLLPAPVLGAKITGLAKRCRLCGGLDQGHRLVCTSSSQEPSKQRLFCLESRVFEVCVFVTLAVDVVLGIEPKFTTCSASASWLARQC